MIVVTKSLPKETEMIQYNGVMRTTLSDQERSDFKELAASRGMTITGLHDQILRNFLCAEKEKQNDKK